MKKLGFFFILFLGLPLTAEVKPEGTLLESYCGENTAAAQERNRFITKVCLANVQGLSTEFVVIHSEDAKGTEWPLQVLPILERSKSKKVSAAPAGVTTEDLKLGTNKADVSGNYMFYNYLRASLRSERLTSSPPNPPTSQPRSISGVDANGVTYQVRKMEPIFHTQSVE